jgi:polyferredoxin
MDEPLTIWSRMLLRLAVLLLALGLVPLLVVGTVLPQFDPLIPVMLSLTLAPLGAVLLVVAVILFLAALVRRRRGSS